MVISFGIRSCMYTFLIFFREHREEIITQRCLGEQDGNSSY